MNSLDDNMFLDLMQNICSDFNLMKVLVVIDNKIQYDRLMNNDFLAKRLEEALKKGYKPSVKPAGGN
jgi:hypothetical protein